MLWVQGDYSMFPLSSHDKDSENDAMVYVRGVEAIGFLIIMSGADFYRVETQIGWAASDYGLMPLRPDGISSFSSSEWVGTNSEALGAPLKIFNLLERRLIKSLGSRRKIQEDWRMNSTLYDSIGCGTDWI